eukprot:1139827-Pelagomonas_calceolata.AAC.2
MQPARGRTCDAWAQQGVLQCRAFVLCNGCSGNGNAMLEPFDVVHSDVVVHSDDVVVHNRCCRSQ